MADEKNEIKDITRSYRKKLNLFLSIIFAICFITGVYQYKDVVKCSDKCAQCEKALVQNEQTLNQIENAYDKNIRDSIIRLKPELDPNFINQLQTSVKTYSKQYNLPPELVVSVIFRESTFKPTVVSSAKCIGLMQINPKAHADKIKVMGITRNEIFHIDNNIHLGCWILRDYIDKYKSVDKALKKYVGGNLSGYVSDILKTYSNLMVKI